MKDWEIKSDTGALNAKISGAFDKAFELRTKAVRKGASVMDVEEMVPLHTVKWLHKEVLDALSDYQKNLIADVRKLNEEAQNAVKMLQNLNIPMEQPNERT